MTACERDGVGPLAVTNDRYVIPNSTNQRHARTKRKLRKPGR